jgi:energy-coupling factor transporter ATP-binding protein EcfA2
VTALLGDDDLGEIDAGPRLASVRVRELFGQYDYDIVVPVDESGLPGRLLLLYGDNGSGKTTILRLLWELLSPADNRGHRGYLAKAAFRELVVSFSDGTVLTAAKIDGLLGSFTLSMARPGTDELVIRYEADDKLNVSSGTRDAVWPDATPWVITESSGEFDVNQLTVEVERAQQWRMDQRRAEEAFLEFLSEARMFPLLLADDRSLLTDDEEIERAKERDADLAKARLRHSAHRIDERAGQAVERELRLTMGRVNDFLRSLTLSGQSSGSAGANTIYGNMLRQLAHLPVVTDSEGISLQAQERAEALLTELEKRSPQFEDFELVPHFAADEFRGLLASVPSGRQQLASEILIPYLESLTTRIEALSEAERVLRALLSLLNDFLVDKKFTFSPRRGLRIVARNDQELPVSALSSGERQLVMLLCTTLLARRSSRLFIIDEPELSLGVRWQRKILGALLDLTAGTSVQFVVATHSVEMISSERPYLVRLKR